MTDIEHVSLGFAGLSKPQLTPFTDGVIDGLTAQAAKFSALPVPVAQLQSLRDIYVAALAAAEANKGREEYALLKNARRDLIAALRKNAMYVEIVSNNDLAVLVSSGYKATSTNRTPVALNQAEVTKVTNPKSGELQASVKAQRNARLYEGRIKEVEGEYGPTISFTSTRRIVFTDLTPGKEYTLQVRAVGSMGSGDWSDEQTRMAM